MGQGREQSFANLLRRHRTEAMLSQAKLAERARLHRDAVARLERGERRRPHLYTVQSLADALELDAEQRAQFVRAALGELELDRDAASPTPDLQVLAPDTALVASEKNETDAEAQTVYLEVSLPVRGLRDARDDLWGEPGFETIEALRTACAGSVARAVAAIPKYAAHLYVPRESINWEFAEFLRSAQPCLLVQGEAGAGKTNLLCHLAQTAAMHFPTLLMRGTTRMAGRLGFWQAIADELSITSGQPFDPRSVVRLLDEALEAGSTMLLIFVDGINENADIPALAESLAYAVADASGTRIRICLSCRDVDWRLFEHEARPTRFFYEPRRSGGRTAKGLFLEDFTDRELVQAWEKYAAHYRLAGDLTPRLAAICRHPLMLQFLCEAFAGRAVPPGIHRKEIFDRYWKEKLRTRHGHATESALYRLVGALYERKRTELREFEALDLIGEREYDHLLSERVILYARTDQLDEQWVGFTYDAFLEYAIARYLWQSGNWATRDGEAIGLDLRSLVEASSAYRAVQGVLMYLMLFLGGAPVARAFLHELAAKDQQWRIFFCDFMTKINDLDFAEDFVPELEALVKDPSFPVRWAAGNSLGLIAQNVSSVALDVLPALANSPDWMDREAAALAASHMYRDFQSAIGMLEHLADDINWRVRRAVGCALDNLCRQTPDESFPVLWEWSRSRRWRLRRVVAQAKYGLLILPNQSQSMDLLGHLAGDEHEEVRWRAVGDLVSMSWYADTRSRALELLMTLTGDPDLTVRKQVAFRLPDLYRSVQDECQEMLRRLVADPDGQVRWETARGLGGLPPGALASACLALLEADTDDDVRFAAAYSMAFLGLSDHRLADLFESGDESRRLRALREQLARSSRVLKVPEQDTDLFITWKHDRYADIMEVLKAGTSQLETPERVQSFFDLLLHDEDEGIRWAVASLLPQVGVLDMPAKAQHLMYLLKDAHYWVRREGLSALQQLVSAAGLVLSPDLAALAIRSVSDTNAEVRLAALHCCLAFRARYATAVDDQVFVSRLADDDRQVRALAESGLRAG